MQQAAVGGVDTGAAGTTGDTRDRAATTSTPSAAGDTTAAAGETGAAGTSSDAGSPALHLKSLRVVAGPCEAGDRRDDQR